METINSEEYIKILSDTNEARSLVFAHEGVDIYDEKSKYLSNEHYNCRMDANNFKCTSDLDSILFTVEKDDLFNSISSDVDWFPFPNREFTFKSKNYMPYVFKEGDITDTNREDIDGLNSFKLNNIVNVCVATSGLSGVFYWHLFFPRLIKKTNGVFVNYMNAVDYKRLYDEFVLPSLHAVERQSFPASYENAKSLSTGTSNRFHFKKWPIAQERTKLFFKNLHDLLDKDPFFGGCFYHIHAKGTKVRMTCLPSDPITPLDLLYSKFGCFDWNYLSTKNLFVDFGIEFLSKKKGFHLYWNIFFAKEYLKSLGLKNLNLYPTVHGYQVGSASASNYSENAQIIFAQLYCKEKNLWCSGKSNTGYDFFSMNDVVRNSVNFQSKMESYVNELEGITNDKDSNYGIR